MLTLIVLLTLQVDVFALHGDPNLVDGARAIVCPNTESCVDASSGHAYLFRPSAVLPFQDFEAFTASPPAWWPASLREVWVKSVAHCHNVAGPPPWKQNFGSVFGCGSDLSSFLWNAWLTELHASRVVIIDVTKLPAGTLIKTEAYQYPADHELIAEETTAKFVPERIKVLAENAMALKGTSLPLNLVKRFASASAEFTSAFLGQTGVKTPVESVTKCDAAPKTLSVTGPPPISDLVTARWSASEVGSSEEAASCVLTETDHQEVLAGHSLKVASFSLKCGKVTVAAESSTIRPDGKSVDAITDALVSKLSKRYCRSP